MESAQQEVSRQEASGRHYLPDLFDAAPHQGEAYKAHAVEACAVIAQTLPVLFTAEEEQEASINICREANTTPFTKNAKMYFWSERSGEWFTSCGQQRR